MSMVNLYEVVMASMANSEIRYLYVDFAVVNGS